jgi:predicted transcriptional regulator
MMKVIALQLNDDVWHRIEIQAERFKTSPTLIIAAAMDAFEKDPPDMPGFLPKHMCREG